MSKRTGAAVKRRTSAKRSKRGVAAKRVDINIAGGHPETSTLGAATLARLAENVWRLDRRARREGSGAWAQSLIERLNDDLRDLGLEIIDRTGTPYRDGETLEKVHSDAPDNWSGPLIVTEVICPTIRYGGVIIEHGKVIVGADLGTESE